MTNYADIEKIENLLVHGIDECGDAIVSLRDVRRAIAQAKNADVVEVIRCKDCQYFYQDGNIKVCKHWNCHSTTDDAYCSYAKKKDDERW